MLFFGELWAIFTLHIRETVKITNGTFVVFAGAIAKSALWRYAIIGINTNGNVRHNISAAVEVLKLIVIASH